MKILSFIFIVVALLSNHVYAAKHVDGFVEITEERWGPKHLMRGTMNVRYNASSGTETSIGANMNWGGYRIYFYGTDDNNNHFFCHVTKNADIYPRALEIYRSLKNGMSITVAHQKNDSRCAYVLSATSSKYLD